MQRVRLTILVISLGLLFPGVVGESVPAPHITDPRADVTIWPGVPDPTPQAAAYDLLRVWFRARDEATIVVEITTLDLDAFHNCVGPLDYLTILVRFEDKQARREYGAYSHQDGIRWRFSLSIWRADGTLERTHQLGGESQSGTSTLHLLIPRALLRETGAAALNVLSAKAWGYCPGGIGAVAHSDEAFAAPGESFPNAPPDGGTPTNIPNSGSTPGPGLALIAIAAFFATYRGAHAAGRRNNDM